LFSEVIDLRLQSVELFLGRIVSGPRNSHRARSDAHADQPMHVI
jgi:hypothetical protein